MAGVTASPGWGRRGRVPLAALTGPVLPCLALLALSEPVSAADWQPKEVVKTYTVSGQSGIELYRSIGENGPTAGVGRAIAVTDFKLLWSRDYRPQADGSCVLAKARPNLTITYRLPKPKGKLPPGTKERWARFIAGIEAHERVHGEMIVDLVKAIEAYSVGLTVADDPGCKKIRTQLTARLSELSQEQRAKSRDFDKVELNDGGNVHQLVLGLVNE